MGAVVVKILEWQVAAEAVEQEFKLLGSLKGEVWAFDSNQGHLLV